MARYLEIISLLSWRSLVLSLVLWWIPKLGIFVATSTVLYLVVLGALHAAPLVGGSGHLVVVGGGEATERVPSQQQRRRVAQQTTNTKQGILGILIEQLFTLLVNIEQLLSIYLAIILLLLALLLHRYSRS